ncbi:MAG: hypothetical protein OXK79_05865 [Chloroflexota bacterium]|nr:hypothetical protein [Chloroflexota bacterium]
MTTVPEIQRAILGLDEREYAELVAWLHERQEADWDEWDRQIEADALAGKLDFLAAEALEAQTRGELKNLEDL